MNRNKLTRKIIKALGTLEAVRCELESLDGDSVEDDIVVISNAEAALLEHWVRIERMRNKERSTDNA